MQIDKKYKLLCYWASKSQLGHSDTSGDMLRNMEDVQ